MFSSNYIRSYDAGGFEKFLFLNRMYEVKLPMPGGLASTNKRFIAYIKVNFYDFENGIWVLRNE